jgi:hypothetical protein
MIPASRFARAASSQSHSAINAPTLETIRCCSAKKRQATEIQSILFFGSPPRAPVCSSKTNTWN